MAGATNAAGFRGARSDLQNRTAVSHRGDRPGARLLARSKRRRQR